MANGVASAYRAMKGYPLVIFLACLFAWTLANMDQSLFGYAIPSLQDEFSADLDAISWILFWSFVVAAIMSVCLGIAADRYGRRIVLVLALAGSALLVGLHALAPTLLVLAIFRALAFGLSNGLPAITNTYVVEASPPRYRGVMMGLLQCGYPLGWFVASILAVPLMRLYGWRAIFLMALVVVPVAFVIGRWLPESQRFTANKANNAEQQQGSWFANIKALFAPQLRRTTLLISLAFFAYGGAYAGTAFYFPTFYTEVRGYSVETATTIVGLSYGIGVIGYISSAVIGEFYLTRRNTIVIWNWLGAFALVGLIWIPKSFGADVFWFSLMATFFYGSNAVIATLLTESFPTRIRATGAAFAGTFAMNLGFAIFPVLVAKTVAVVGWQWAFTVAVVPSLFVSGLAILGLKNVSSGLDLDEIAR
jgi:MFS family permease